MDTFMRKEIIGNALSQENYENIANTYRYYCEDEDDDAESNNEKV
jgi:hypothetical protein